jgi:predicted RNA-binding Zn-ribbon protein involved in translation (DUF1610 family)
MNRRAAEERLKLVADGGAPRCPACGVQQVFQSDRHGRTYTHCDCGYRAYLERRTGKREGSFQAT